MNWTKVAAIGIWLLVVLEYAEAFFGFEGVNLLG